MVFVIPFILVLLVVTWGFLSSSLLLKIVRSTIDFNPKSFGHDFETFRTLTDDQIEIEGWFIPAKKQSSSVIVVLHGWGANRSDVLASTIYLGENYNLVYFDFRNHGRSGGKETSLTCLEIKDLEAVIRLLRTEKKEFTKKVGIFGFSMGGSVAISGSVKIPEIAAVIAESPFSSYKGTVIRFAKLFYGVPKPFALITLLFVRMRLGFDPEDCSPIHHISKISPRPVFIIQGGQDERMPVSEGESLYEAAKEPKEFWVVPEARHGNIQEQVPKEYKKRVLTFLQKWMQN